MGADRRLTILLTPAEYGELQRRAGLVPLSTWIRHQVLGARTVEAKTDEVGDDKNLRKPGAAGVVQRVSRAPKRTKGTSPEPTTALPFDPRTGAVQGTCQNGHPLEDGRLGEAGKCKKWGCEFYAHAR